MSLSVKDHMTLAVERSWWKYPGAKDEHIRVVLGEDSVRYHLRLNALLDDPDAEAAYPLLVRRLRRLRAARRLARRHRW